MPKVGNAGFVELIDVMGNDITVVNAARVSFNKISSWNEVASYRDDGFIDVAYQLNESDTKLIKYLARHKHWTPFAHPQITLHIKAPIPIRTQFFKHKIGFTENEISRRYVDDPPEFFVPEFSGRPVNKKQGAGAPLSDEVQNKLNYLYCYYLDAAKTAYESLLVHGVAPEQARFILPQATYTEWYWTGSLAAFARFYNLRSAPHAQAEIRDYAKEVGEIIAPYFPVSWAALTNTEVKAE